MPLFNTFVLFILAELGNVLSTWVLKQWAESNQQSPAPTSPISSSLLAPSSLTSTQISSTSPNLLYFHSDSSSEKDPSREARLDRYILLYLLTGLFALAFELIRETYFTCRSIIAGRKIYERLIGTLLSAQGELCCNPNNNIVMLIGFCFSSAILRHGTYGAGA
jgi:hypothetical protein